MGFNVDTSTDTQSMFSNFYDRLTELAEKHGLWKAAIASRKEIRHKSIERLVKKKTSQII